MVLLRIIFRTLSIFLQTSVVIDLNPLILDSIIANNHLELTLNV